MIVYLNENVWRNTIGRAAMTALLLSLGLPVVACDNFGRGSDGSGSGDSGGKGAVPCQGDSDCQQGWKCKQVADSGKFCAPKKWSASDDDPAECDPAPERCNGTDDDCDGQTDEGFLENCDDDDACNGTEKCAKGECVNGQPPNCDDGQWCTADSCEAATGCVHEPAPENTTCSDGDACTGCALPAGVVKLYALSAAANCPEKDAVGCNALWMPGFFDGVSKHVVRFTFAPGAQLLWMIDGSATITAQAEVYHLGDGPGVLGQKWNVAMTLAYRGQGAAGEGGGGPKLDDGWVVPKAVSDTWHYFDITAASMAEVGGMGKVALTQKPANSVFPFQLGKGANGKTLALSSSAWLDWVKTTPEGQLKGHGDINVDVEPKPPTDCDVCVTGQCKAGKVLTCDDANPCTIDACAQGQCVHTETTFGPCDDGIACTSDDQCVEGKCIGKKKKVALCDDDNPCTYDDCKNGVGCVHDNVQGACDDGDVCTKGDHCKAGNCTSGTAVQCGDDNPCTLDGCDPAFGCAYGLADKACDDGDACTSGDACKGGKCKGGKATGCDDGNPCTQDGCDGLMGCYHLQQADGPCDDGNACTSGDLCTKGVCKPGPLVECGDTNPCTLDQCDYKAGCQNPPQNGAACDDGSACSAGDACAGGLCKGGNDVVCSDDNVCTKDLCDAAKGCVFVPISGQGCSDDDACTAGDSCMDGACVVGKPLNCNDSNVCTADQCDAKAGCKHLFLDGANCHDGTDCTGLDLCKGGACKSGAPVVCNDNNPCTADTCDSDKGCLYSNLDGTGCSDGTVCTVGDVCKLGKCSGGQAIVCNDNNICTQDGCDAKSGCVTIDYVGKPCDDGDACTAADSCKGGKCQGTAPVKCNDGNPCTIDTCNAQGGCVAKNGDGIGCDDGNPCTQADKCKGGSCAAGAPKLCDDGNACTADLCDPKAGCTAKPADGKACEDGDKCTTGDNCKAGKCAPGQGNACDDGNPCTKDGCDIVKGCTHGPIDGGACNDGSACTIGDNCKSGLCVGPKPIVCDDGSDCTSDFCDAKGGCFFPPNDGIKCDDGDACSGDSMCKGGKCAGFKWTVCDDGNPCTADACDKAKGSVASPADGKSCNDGDACSLDDACLAGACKGKTKALCNDSNPCTSDGCDPANGCWAKPVSSAAGSVTLYSDGKTLANGAPAVATWNQHKSWTVNIAGATWIWTSYHVTNPVGESVVTFVRNFDVPLGATGFAGSLVVGADNSYVCTLNGAVVGQDATEFNYFESSKDTWQLGGALKAGQNTLQCIVKNWAMPGGNSLSNPAGLLYRLDANWNQVVPCDDGSACTTGDVCKEGKCTGGVSKVCNDNNPCTTDSCDAKTGTCAFSGGVGAPCNDSNACTGACLPAGVSKQWQVAMADTNPNVGWAGGGHAIHLPGFCAGAFVRMTFDADARFDISTDGSKGHMHGHATIFQGGGGCNVGDKWFADVWFNYRGKGVAGQGAGGPKKELKDGYQPKALTDTWLYFDMIPGQATLTRVGNPNDVASLTQAPAGSMYPFQIGIGANGKSLNFGASSWFHYTHKAPGGVWSGQGDFNLDLHWLDPAATCDQCTNGKCQGAPVSCDDKNPFTIDSCTPQGGCKHTPTNVCQAG